MPLGPVEALEMEKPSGDSNVPFGSSLTGTKAVAPLFSAHLPSQSRTSVKLPMIEVAATLSDAAVLPEPEVRSVPGARDDADVNDASEAESDAMPSNPVEAAALESSASSVTQVAPGARKAAHSAAVFGLSSIAIASQRRTAKLETATPSDGAPLSKSKARSTPAGQDKANENASFGSP